MEHRLAFFPLQLVVYPNEELHLHIFEERYRQLISDCLREKITFGIPAYFEDKVHEFGTEVQVEEIINEYPDGRMDIVARGRKVFKMETFENPMYPKLYAGGIVHFQELTDFTNLSERILLIEKANELFELLETKVELSHESHLLSFKIAHLIGLSINQEYQLLQLTSESDRIRFLIDHLTRNIPIIRQTALTKERIRRNGHFKHFDPLKF